MISSHRFSFETASNPQSAQSVSQQGYKTFRDIMGFTKRYANQSELLPSDEAKIRRLVYQMKLHAQDALLHGAKTQDYLMPVRELFRTSSPRGALADQVQPMVQNSDLAQMRRMIDNFDSDRRAALTKSISSLSQRRHVDPDSVRALRAELTAAQEQAISDVHQGEFAQLAAMLAHLSPKPVVPPYPTETNVWASPLMTPRGVNSTLVAPSSMPHYQSDGASWSALRPPQIQPEVLALSSQSISGLSALSVHDVIIGEKEKLVPHTYQHITQYYERSHPGQPLSLSTLYYQNKQAALIMTSSMHRGSFGKVRYAFDRTGTIYAVKELRTKMSLNTYTKTGRTPTYPLPLPDILQEVATTQALRHVIDESMRFHDAPERDSQQSLRSVRTKSTPFMLKDVVQVANGKVHVVMNAESGDLRGLVGQLTQSEQHTLALSVAAQGFTELGILHGVGRYAHQDLKLDNLFFNRDGQIKIMDFGLAQPINLSTRTTQTKGIVGTIISPEMFADTFERRHLSPMLSAANDVWAMGVTVMEAAGTGFEGSPFYRVQRRRNDADDGYVLQTSDLNLHRFEAWRRSLIDPKTKRVDLTRIHDKHSLGMMFVPLKSASPALCSLILEHVLLENPKDRMKADVVAQHARDALAQMPNQRFAALQKRMTQADDAVGVRDLQRVALAYDQWLEQRRPGVR